MLAQSRSTFPWFVGERLALGGIVCRLRLGRLPRIARVQLNVTIAANHIDLDGLLGGRLEGPLVQP